MVALYNVADIGQSGMHANIQVDFSRVTLYREDCKMGSFVQEGLDVWSLGVMAFELLTGERAIKIHKGKEEVRSSSDGQCSCFFLYVFLTISTYSRKLTPQI